MLKSLAAIGALALLGAGVPARGGMLGAVVDVRSEYPTIGAVYDDAGAKTIGGTVEYPAGSFPTYNNSWSIDLTDTQIVISGDGFPFAPASFNGWDIEFLSGSIASALADGGSSFNPAGISISGNHLYLNYQGVTHTGAGTSIIDVTGTAATGVPEPASMALLGAGVLGLGVLRRTRA